MSNHEDEIQAIILLLTAVDAPAQIADVFGDRLFPHQAPDDAQAPYLTFFQLEENYIETSDGPVNAGWTFEVQIVADRYQTVKKGARAVRAAIIGKTIEVPNIGNLYLTIVDGADRDIIEERNLLTMALEFRAYKS